MNTIYSLTDREPKGTGFSLSTKAFLALIEGMMLLPVEGRVSRRDFTLREIEEGRTDSANKVTLAMQPKYTHSITLIHSNCISGLFYRLFTNLFHTPPPFIPQYRMSGTLPLQGLTHFPNATDSTHTTSAKGTKRKTTWRAQSITSRQANIFFTELSI